VLVQTLTTGGISTAVYPAQDVTNNSGRFRLTGLPAANAALVAVPLDRPYLPAVQAAIVPDKGAAMPVEVRLKRGVWVRGRVTDAQTGRPLAAGVKYFAAADNPGLAGLDGYEGAAALPWPPNPPAYRTDADGWYAVPGLPGKGIVTATATGSYDRYMLGVGAGGVPGASGKGWMAWIQARPEPCSASQFHTLAAVDVPPGGKDADGPDLRPDTGETLTGTVLGPDGRPLAGATLFGGTQTGLVHNPTPHPTAEFRVRHYTPEWPRLLLLAHPEKKLAGSLLVRGQQPGKLSVRLQPGGTVTGTVVDAAGKPRAGVAVRATWSATTPEELTAGAVAFPLAYYRTDKDGRFRIDGLAPGVKYYGLVLAETGERLASDIVVKSGETKELGRLAPKRD
jgi:protocatechuate 3,4-dioxygenase beta subunit